jgi:hypothetical protein
MGCLMPLYVSNHLPAKCYLDGFTDETGRLMVVRRHTDVPRPAKPKNVGYRNYFWGREQHLRTAVEQRMSRLECDAADVLREIPRVGLPKPGDPERGSLIQFLALHLVRTPRWRDLIFELRDRELRAQGHDRPGFEALAREIRSDEWWITTLMRHIPQISVLFGSMYWDLLEFERPWLLTSDQPLVQFPFIRHGDRVRIDTPLPGLVNSVEYRFAIDPYRALVLSWFDAPETGDSTNGTYAVAADLNRTVGARTDKEFFFRPGSAPPFVAPPWRSGWLRASATGLADLGGCRQQRHHR